MAAEFTITLNVAGLGFFEPGSPIERLSRTAPYEGVITEVERVANNDKSKPDNIMFSIHVKAEGKTVKRWLSVSPDPESITAREWKNLLASIVKNPAALEQGPANVTSKLLTGKPCYIYNQIVPGKDAKNRDNLPNINFITKEMMAKLAASASAPAGAAATGPMTIEGGTASNGAAPSAGTTVALE